RDHKIEITHLETVAIVAFHCSVHYFYPIPSHKIVVACPEISLSWRQVLTYLPAGRPACATADR
ncbi:MAG: hypothetical protein ACPL28_10150, partial [bacterium]